MAKREKAPKTADDATLLATIVYVGPDKAESPVFGSLSVGSRYQASADFAAYLVATHPDHWQRPDAASGRE